MIDVTYRQIDIYCKLLAMQIEESKKKYEYLFAVPMGGFPVAVGLSVHLDLPIKNKYKTDGSILVVDDLIDSGNTLEYYPENDKAVIFVKNKKMNDVTYYCQEINEWVNFPWEKENNIDDHITRMFQYYEKEVDVDKIEIVKNFIKNL